MAYTEAVSGDSAGTSKPTILAVMAAAAAIALVVAGFALATWLQPSATTPVSSTASKFSTARSAAPTPTTRSQVSSAPTASAKLTPAAATPSIAPAELPEQQLRPESPPAEQAAPRQAGPAQAPAALSPAQPPATCPPDAGVVLSIAAAELVYEGHVMDEYRVTMSLHNRIGVPVTLSQIGSVAITSVRADGAEMGAGFVHIPQTYEVLPGKTTFVLDSDTTTYHGFGSPVTSLN